MSDVRLVIPTLSEAIELIFFIQDFYKSKRKFCIQKSTIFNKHDQKRQKFKTCPDMIIIFLF